MCIYRDTPSHAQSILSLLHNYLSPPVTEDFHCPTELPDKFDHISS